MNIRTVVDRRLSGSELRCYGHCDRQSAPKFLPGQPYHVACIACPSGYVSRIIMYEKELDISWFKRFLSSTLDGLVDLSDEDIRIATRHPWDLDLIEAEEDVVLRQAYWTQSYRRTKSDDLGRPALFVCSTCDTLFLQSLNSNETKCQNCRSKHS